MVGIASSTGIGLPRKVIETQLDPVFQAAVDSKRIAGVAAIALDAKGKVLFSKGYGSIDATDENAPKVTPKTALYVFSCTKLITSVAALQLLEQKRFKLDDLVEKYVPEFAKIQVLEAFDEQGKPRLRAPTTKAKLINLFTHTTGLTYDFFDKDTLQWRIGSGTAPANYAGDSTVAYFSTPLKFDPGKAYNYGTNTDFLGLVVERISGLKLDAYIQKNILQPLGLHNTGLGLEGKDFFNCHMKDEAGKLTPNPGIRNNQIGEFVPGGQYITSTAEDYAQFLLTVLNYGTHPLSKVKILKDDTVKKYIFQDQLASINIPNKGVGEVVTSIPQMSCTGTMLPGITKGWSLGLLTNSDDFPNGRKAGSGFWTGLDNCYYWLDPTSGKLGFIASPIFPWFDKDVLHLFDSLERAVYGKPLASKPGEPGSNFSGGEWARG